MVLVFHFAGNVEEARFSWSPPPAEEAAATLWSSVSEPDMHNELNEHRDQRYHVGDKVRVRVHTHDRTFQGVVKEVRAPTTTFPFFQYTVKASTTRRPGRSCSSHDDSGECSVWTDDALEIVAKTTARKGYNLDLQYIRSNARGFSFPAADDHDTDYISWLLLGVAVLGISRKTLLRVLTAFHAHDGENGSTAAVLGRVAATLRHADAGADADTHGAADWRDYTHGNAKTLVFLMHHPVHGERFRNEFPNAMRVWLDHAAPCVVKQCYEKNYDAQTFGYMPQDTFRKKIRSVAKKWSDSVEELWGGGGSNKRARNGEKIAVNNSTESKEWTLVSCRHAALLHAKKRLFAESALCADIIADLDAGPAKSALFHFEMSAVPPRYNVAEGRRAIYAPVHEFDVRAERRFKELLAHIRHGHSATAEHKERVRRFLARTAEDATTFQSESQIAIQAANDAINGRIILTDSQRELLARQLLEPFAIVTGPPGTGKTSCGLSFIVKFYLEELKFPPESIICITPTGKAFKSLCKSLGPAAGHGPTARVGEEGEGDGKDVVVQTEIENRDGVEDDDDDDDDDDDEDEVDGDGDGEDDDEDTEAYLQREALRSVYGARIDEIPGFAEARRHAYRELGIPVPKPQTTINNNTETRYNTLLSATINRLALLCRLSSKNLNSLDVVRAKRKGIVIIVDELSMVSSNLFDQLLVAISTLEARAGGIEKIVFCGDDKQLASIEHGNVLGNLLQYPSVQPYICRYEKIERQSYGARRLSELVAGVRKFMDSEDMEINLTHTILRCKCNNSEDSSGDTSFSHPVSIDKQYKDVSTNDLLKRFQNELFSGNPLPKLITHCNDDSYFANLFIQKLVTERRTKDPRTGRNFRDLYAAHAQATQTRGGTWRKPTAKEFGFKPLDLLVRTKNLQEYDQGGGRTARFFVNGEEAMLLGVYDAVFRDDHTGRPVPQKIAMVEYVDTGERQEVTLTNLQNEFKLAYAYTVHKSQGSTLRSVIYFEPFKNENHHGKLNAQLFWVAMSRAAEKLIYAGPRVVFLLRKTNFSPLFFHRGHSNCIGECLNCDKLVYSPKPWLTETQERRTLLNEFRKRCMHPQCTAKSEATVQFF